MRIVYTCSSEAASPSRAATRNYWRKRDCTMPCGGSRWAKDGKSPRGCKRDAEPACLYYVSYGRASQDYREGQGGRKANAVQRASSTSIPRTVWSDPGQVRE